MRTAPEDLAENLMKPISLQKMNRRDMRRGRFIQEYRRKLRIKQSFKLSIEEELEKFKDLEEGKFVKKQMKYMQLVESINEDIKALEY